MNIPHIRPPRSLFDHPAVIAAPCAQFKVLIYLVEGACFLPCKQDDHGKLIDLLPGQIMITQRGFAKWINVKENDVRRAIERFSKVEILTQKVTHKKTIITITHKDTYELIKQYSDAKNDAKVTQERRKNDAEKDNVDNADNGEKDISLARSASLPRKRTDIFFDFEHGEWENIKPDDIATWQQAYPAITVNQELLYMREWCLSEPKAKSKKLWRKFITSWLGRSNEKKLNFESSKAQNPNSRAVLGGKRLTEYDNAW